MQETIPRGWYEYGKDGISGNKLSTEYVLVGRIFIGRVLGVNVMRGEALWFLFSLLNSNYNMKVYSI